MLPVSTIVSYTSVEAEEKYELYAMLLHYVDLFSVVLFIVDKSMCISVDLA